MVLLGAMASWAGQVFIDSYDPDVIHGNYGVDNELVAPGATIPIYVMPYSGYVVLIGDVVIDEYDADDIFVQTLTPSGPSETADGVPDQYTFVMPADATHNVRVSVTFSGVENPINGSPNQGGSFCISHINGDPITPEDPDNPWNGHARTGDIVTLTAIPDLGWDLVNFSVFANAIGDYVPVAPVDPVTSEFTMPASPVDIQVFFRQLDYTITIDNSTANGNGTIDVFMINGYEVPPGTPQPYVAHAQEMIELKISPNNGYEIYWIDLVAVDSNYDKMLNDGEADFVMPPCNITLRPHFREARFTLTMDINGSGSVRAMPSSNLHAGRRVSLDVTPGRGYMLQVSDLVVEQIDGGIVAGTLNLEPFSDIMWDNPSPPFPTTAFTLPFAPPYNVRVTADFQPVEYTVDCNPPAVGGTFLVSDIAGNPPAALGYDPRHVQAHIGQVITLTNTPATGYTFIQYIATYHENDGIDVPITINSSGQFTMPPGPVTIQAVFKHAYTLDLIQNALGGTLYVQTINSSSPPPLPCTVYEGDVIVVGCTPPPGYDVDQFILQDNAANCFSAMPGNPATFVIDNTIPAINDLYISVVFEPREYRILVQQDPNGYADALNQNTQNMGINIVGFYNDPIELIAYPALYYELDYYEVREVDHNTTFTLYPTVPPTPIIFTMPDSRVIVIPHFKLKDYTITVDMQYEIGGLVTATNTSATPQTSTTAGWTGTTYNALIDITAKMGDVIRLTFAGDFATFSYPELQYYTFKRTDDDYYIGGMVPTRPCVIPHEAVFTMPPCNLTISAVIHDTSGQWLYPNPNVLWYNARYNGGIVYLEDLTWLDYKSKSSPDEEEPNLEYCGWAPAIPGEPMHFVVIPDPGYQVRKSDITVRLIEAPQGEGDDEGKVLKTFKGGDGIEIFGPDEFVTERTEYYFIFDVPEGVDPYTVKVEIDANFIPIDFAITVDGAIEHGTITAPATANVGETVTLNVTPEPGYSLAEIMVLPELPGYIVEVDSNNQFTMPACNVMVTAVFEEGGHDFAPGDVNHDGMVGIEDVTTLIDYILGNTGDICDTCADVSGDGLIGIADVTGIIDIILGGN